VRVVIDTNVLISAIFWTGKPKQLLNHVRRKNITFVTSKHLLNELKEILIRDDKPFHLSENSIAVLDQHIRPHPIVIGGIDGIIVQLLGCRRGFPVVSFGDQVQVHGAFKRGRVIVRVGVECELEFVVVIKVDCAGIHPPDAIDVKSLPGGRTDEGVSGHGFAERLAAFPHPDVRIRLHIVFPVRMFFSAAYGFLDVEFLPDVPIPVTLGFIREPERGRHRDFGRLHADFVIAEMPFRAFRDHRAAGDGEPAIGRIEHAVPDLQHPVLQ